MSTARVLEARVRAENPHTGIDVADAKQLVDGLSRSLAETYVLYVKTQGCHWNVVGPLFYGLHKLTADLLTDRIHAHEEAAWMLRSIASG